MDAVVIAAWRGSAPCLAVVCGLAGGPRTLACERVAHDPRTVELGETRLPAIPRRGARAEGEEAKRR
jgi:hypothetical protein